MNALTTDTQCRWGIGRGGGKMRKENKKNHLRDYKNSLYPIFSLHAITFMYRKNCRPRRSLVYKGFSKNAELDETNQTKAFSATKGYGRIITAV